MVVRSVALVAVFSSPRALADEGWTAIGTKNGVAYEKRAVSGSKFLEYRATTQVSLAPPQVLQTMWKVLTDLPPSEVKSRRFLKRAGDEVVVHDHVNAPVVSDREVVIRFHKAVRPDGIEVRFESTDALAPPPDPKYVRVPALRGAWILVAVPGGTRLTFVCYSDPGGSVPAFMIRGAQADHVAADVERMLSFLRRG